MKALLVAAAALAVFAAGAAWACSCVRYVNAAEHVSHVDAIFRARAVATVQDSGWGTTTFEVVTPMLIPGGLSALPPRIDVRHAASGGGGSCAIEFTPGAEVLVIAVMDHAGQLYTSLCSAPQFTENEYRAALHLDPAPR